MMNGVVNEKKYRGENLIGDTKTAIGAIVVVIIVAGVANYFGAGIEASLITGAITAVAALATPGAASGNENTEE